VIVDYHIHSPYCGHAHGQIIQYIQTAIQKGIDEICFTDHLGRYYLSKLQKKRLWDWGMNERNLPRYLLEISDLREVFSHQISIKTGLEIDFVEGADELLKSTINDYSFDFKIGSVHCLPRISWKHLSEIQETPTDRIYNEYFRIVNAALKSKLFQSIAHIDFIWRYFQTPSGGRKAVEVLLDNAIQCAIENDCCIEINANGFMWSQANAVDKDDLFFYMLKKIGELGAKTTIGSDAHEPFLVGKSYQTLIPLLKEYNITSTCIFSDCKQQIVPLG